MPVKDDSGEIQAAGCGDLTFTGTSFDLQNVALAGVRLAVSTLLANKVGGYPDTSWDVGVLALRNSAKELVAPQWETRSLNIHPACPYCSGA